MTKSNVILLFIAFAIVGAVPGLAEKATRTKVDLANPRFSFLSDLTPGTKPATYLRTNSVVYRPGESITLLLSIDPNDHNFEKTFFLYLQNMQTGQINYINQDDGLLPVGTITDYSGASLDEVEAFQIPEIEDWVLLGEGGDNPAISVTAEMVNNHQFVWEFRDVTGQRIFQRVNWGFAVVNEVQNMPREVTSGNTVSLSSDNAYFMDNAATFVREGGELVIEPGTYILAQGQSAVLVVERGGKITAEGTPGRPIVMTSAQPVGQRFRADWGGLVLNGRGPINVPGGEAISEGFETEEILYGGGENPDENDSSGTLRYLRIEFAGAELSPDNELNGIAFQGCGRGTVADHLQVHFNLDDGVEFFGGTAQVKYLVLTANADDSMDWTEGWTGKAQFVVAQQRKDDADQGIEADNNAENNNLLPRSNPTIYNVTLIGGLPVPDSEDESDIGALLREGTAGTLRNFVVTGFGDPGLVVDMDSTIEQAGLRELIVTNSLFYDNGSTGEENFGVGSNVTVNFDTEEWMMEEGKMNRQNVDPKLRDPFNTVAPDWRPQLESPVLNVNYVASPPDDGFFEPVFFIGAVGPGHDWTVGWTTSAPN